MKIHVFVLGELAANCYLIENGTEAILIDPADEGSFLLEELQRRNLELVGLLATHGHFDHVMAAGEIQLSFPVPLYINGKDEFLIQRLESTARHFLGHTPIMVKPGILKKIDTGVLQISSFSITVLTTPGHTPGSVCYYFPDDQALFTGDTLFAGTVGRTDLSYSDKADLKHSLATLSSLPEVTAVYPGHGEETLIANEKGVTLF